MDRNIYMKGGGSGSGSVGPIIWLLCPLFPGCRRSPRTHGIIPWPPHLQQSAQWRTRGPWAPALNYEGPWAMGLWAHKPWHGHEGTWAHVLFPWGAVTLFVAWCGRDHRFVFTGVCTRCRSVTHAHVKPLHGTTKPRDCTEPTALPGRCHRPRGKLLAVRRNTGGIAIIQNTAVKMAPAGIGRLAIAAGTI